MKSSVAAQLKAARKELAEVLGNNNQLSNRVKELSRAVVENAKKEAARPNRKITVNVEDEKGAMISQQIISLNGSKDAEIAVSRDGLISVSITK